MPSKRQQGEQNRKALAKRLGKRPKSVADLVAETGINTVAVWRGLTRLVADGVAQVTKEGRRGLYTKA